MESAPHEFGVLYARDANDIGSIDEIQLKMYPFLRYKSSTRKRYHMSTACLPIHVYQFILRIPIFLLFFHHFKLFIFANFKLTCFEVLECAGHPFGQIDFLPCLKVSHISA
ncbi:unnamed protein product [Heligmosomoides polygyrus]|uniref:Uncharacterized protein n=1 Tax=Heligmosomoides polygyrus TaxID=6339 RepID=A0A183FE16_HELPZ|nr:unnamed protein product [Heligmosomoides polygyrus]